MIKSIIILCKFKLQIFKLQISLPLQLNKHLTPG